MSEYVNSHLSVLGWVAPRTTKTSLTSHEGPPQRPEANVGHVDLRRHVEHTCSFLPPSICCLGAATGNGLGAATELQVALVGRMTAIRRGGRMRSGFASISESVDLQLSPGGTSSNPLPYLLLRAASLVAVSRPHRLSAHSAARCPLPGAQCCLPLSRSKALGPTAVGRPLQRMIPPR